MTPPVPQLPTIGEVLTLAEVTRAAELARVLIAGALNNEYVKEYVRDLTPWHKCHDLWTVASVRRNPPVRVEFEHAFALGGLGETLAACKGKATFGEFVGVFPVEQFDPVGEVNIVYVFKDSSPYNRRVQQRRWMKKRLGKGWRRLVGQAMYENKGNFLKKHGTTDAAHWIKRRFGLTLGEFWRAARGKTWLDIPKPAPERPALFADDQADDAPPALARRPRPVTKPATKPAPAPTPSLFDDPKPEEQV